jgi:heme-degrading monooxygenase HmoA
MYTAIVTYRPNETLTNEEIRARFEASTPIFASMPGLVRKYFCFDAHKREGTSLYIWESKEAAEACFESPQFLDGFRQAFGCEPSIDYSEIWHTVDNA